jgi:hypothetical protein
MHQIKIKVVFGFDAPGHFGPTWLFAHRRVCNVTELAVGQANQVTEDILKFANEPAIGAVNAY